MFGRGIVGLMCEVNGDYYDYVSPDTGDLAPVPMSPAHEYSAPVTGL